MRSRPKLSELGSSLVSDILDQLGVEGVVPGLSPIYEGAFAVGRAMPVLIESKPNAPKGLREGLNEAVDAAGKGAVLVISSDTRSCSIWGGLTSLYAKLSGIAGVVACGATRDTREIARLRLPVFSYTVTPVSGYNRVEVLSVGYPVKCEPITVQKDDLVVADKDGTVVVPTAMVQDVLDRATPLLAKEKQQIRDLRKKVRGTH